jgi:hypothetical protein
MAWIRVVVELAVCLAYTLVVVLFAMGAVHMLRVNRPAPPTGAVRLGPVTR